MIESGVLSGIHFSLSMVVGICVKILMIMLTMLALIAVRQASLMDKVVTIPVGNWFKSTSWIYFFVSLILTIGIVLLV